MSDRHITDPDLPEYDNLPGLRGCYATGRLNVRRTPQCERLYETYACAYGEALR